MSLHEYLETFKISSTEQDLIREIKELMAHKARINDLLDNNDKLTSRDIQVLESAYQEHDDEIRIINNRLATFNNLKD